VNELPTGWVRAPLHELARVQLGRQRSPKNHQGTHMRPYMRAANVTWNGLDLSDVKEMNFDPDEAIRFELQPGDLLLAEASGSASEVGKPMLWKGEVPGACFQNTLLRVQTFGPLPEYLLHYFQHLAVTGAFAKGSRGVGIHHLGKLAMEQFKIPIAPLAEQRRIVDAIEECFTHIDAASALGASLRVQFGRLRGQVIDGLLSQAEWPRRSVEDICVQIADCPHSTARFTSEGVPCIDTTNIVPSHIVGERIRFVDEATYHERVARLVPTEGDVIFAREGTVGTAVVVPPSMRLCLGQRVMILRLKKEYSPEFVEIALNSSVIRRQWRAQVLGTTAPHLNVRDVKKLLVPAPPRDEQMNVVDEVRRACSIIDSATSDIDRAADKAAVLRRSILAAAYSGQLVPQNPDEEPADLLLDRIRAESVTSSQVRPRRGKIRA
jgi:type I restriction enzyme S subunit